MTDTVLAAQTVNWTDPDAAALFRRIYWRQAIRERPLTLLMLSIFLLMGLMLPENRVGVLAGVLVAIAMIALGTRIRLKRLSQAALAAGESTYQLGSTALHVQNSLGTFRIPFSQMGHTFEDPEGLLVVYAGNSMLTLPNGPVKDGVLAVLPHVKK